MQEQLKIVHENFLRRVCDGDFPSIDLCSLDDATMTPGMLLELFESQCLSRHLDFQSRELQSCGEGFYTIGSSGHEGNAAIASAFRRDDMAFLHYRDTAFYIQRAKKLAGTNPMRALLLSFTTSSDDPISGGRHKVLGSMELFIPPQTSTIASHLPKAVGAAFSIGVAKRLKHKSLLPADSVVLASFGDASANHSTAQGAFNTAGWASYKNISLPIVFVCEDNGIGISVRTPPGWIEASFRNRPGLRYFTCNGLDVVETYRVAREAEEYTRRTRKPAFLHMHCVRLFGHAGSDVQDAYLSREEIATSEQNDPLIYTAAHLARQGGITAEQITAIYRRIADEVRIEAEVAIQCPKMTTTEEVMASIIPPKRPQSSVKSTKGQEAISEVERVAMEKPQPMAKLLNWTLAGLMSQHENIVLAGEDVGAKGGVYGVTNKLASRFGAHRVIDTLLDEQSILGLAIGMAHNNILLIPEIQFLAYLHNAEDQLRGEAATLSFFSNGQYTNPMVIRIAGLAYQKGFGGHFHNDNSLAVLTDIPGIVVACPSNGADAVGMLRESVRLAQEEQRVVVFIEPIAVYHTRDLHESGDGEWMHAYNEDKPISFGEVGQWGDGTQLAIVTYGNGVYLARQAAKELQEKHEIELRIIDLRWLAPLNMEAVAESVKPCKHILIVDECRDSGSISERLVTQLHERLGPLPPLKRHAAKDSFIPLGRVATVTLPSKESITKTAISLIKNGG